MVAKLSLASRGVPKLELGNEKKGGMRFAFPPYRLTPDHWLLAPGPCHLHTPSSPQPSLVRRISKWLRWGDFTSFRW